MTRSSTVLTAFAFVVVNAPLTLAQACVFDIPLGTTTNTQPNLPTPPNGPIDVLIVVDNSGSMLEEQQTLARSFFKPECPIQDLVNVPEQLQNPAPEQLAELIEVCGFTQLLAAFDRDFRVGVITTDVNACDNLLPDSTSADGFPDWGHRPQRGCLHPVPSTGERFLTRAGLQNGGTFTELNEILEGIRTFGSPFERGLDAVDMFLAGDTFAEECAEDAALFVRQEAQLFLVFITDEDDCSHADGLAGFDDETSDICGEDFGPFIYHSGRDCYEDDELLVTVSEYASRFRALKGAGREHDVKLVVIGGAVEAVDGEYAASGCYADDAGDAASNCFESGGQSNVTDVDGAICSPSRAEERGGLDCCTADAGDRYADLALRLGGRVDTICRDDFVDPMMKALE